MSNFRTRLLGLAAVATAFAGVSYGQVISACVAGVDAILPINPTLRAEGQTELVSDVTETACQNTVATTGTVFATLSLPVTSRALTPPAGAIGGGNSDAILQVTTTASGVVNSYFGTVSGTTVSFTGVAFPAAAAGVTAFTMTIFNVRVNASTGGAPQVTETVVINYSTGATTSANFVTAAQNVGYILTTLGATTMTAGVGTATGTSVTYTTCGGNAPGSTLTTPVFIPVAGVSAGVSFAPQIKELLAGSFKSAGAAPSGEGGTLVGAGAASCAAATVGCSTSTNVLSTSVGSANTATQITITYANIPATATVWVPVSETITTGGTSTTLTTTGTPPTSGPFSGAFAGAAGTTYGAFVAFTPSSGTVVVTYTTSLVGTGAAGAQTWVIPTVVTFAANSAAAQGPMTAQAAYAPVGAITGPASVIPTFLASTLPAASGSSIIICQTSVLFPFVTNQLGFDTGLVLANTSTDVLGFGGTSAAKPNSGTCLLSFFGAGAPTPSSGVADPLGVNTTGGTHAFLLSSVAPGFQGYVIATCPMLYIHGYAFIEFNLTQSSGVVEGYLAPNLAGRPTGAGPEATTF